MTKQDFIKSKLVRDLWDYVKQDNKNITRLSDGIQYGDKSQSVIYHYEKGMLTLKEALKLL